MTSGIKLMNRFFFFTREFEIMKNQTNYGAKKFNEMKNAMESIGKTADQIEE